MARLTRERDAQQIATWLRADSGEDIVGRIEANAIERFVLEGVNQLVNALFTTGRGVPSRTPASTGDVHVQDTVLCGSYSPCANYYV